jgi:hypothetical protein
MEGAVTLGRAVSYPSLVLPPWYVSQSPATEIELFDEEVEVVVEEEAVELEIENEDEVELEEEDEDEDEDELDVEELVAPI